MLKKYTRLKVAMIEKDLDEKHINRMLDRGCSYMTNKMNDRSAWRLDDVYKICDILHIPYDEIHLYFPK